MNKILDDTNSMDRGSVRLIVPDILKQRGLSTLDMMYGARISQGTAYHLARGDAERISFNVLKKLCMYFNLEPGDLLKYDK